ncbi:hypothetical protein [Ahrensia sp. R2A130]|uniref:hypothetical protein n=1 Tax=Ahrensia sp. R2A130 TaxID=744979 RepID=UPI0001E0CA35|nr:hypothetical protein [Ahrensia sp. R2A130]EFL87879.1 Na+/solute symporter [Ahrensia sp. R2A130]
MRSGNRELNTSRRALVVQWFSGAAFLAAILVLMLLDRLGLPLGTGLSVLSVALALLVIIIVLAGTTLSSPLFFFAGRKLDPSVLGIGGASDFVGAAFLLAVLGMPSGQQSVLVAALVTGMVVQAVLFVPIFQRAQMATLTGFMGVRARGVGEARVVALMTMVISGSVLAAMSVAEYGALQSLFDALQASVPPLRSDNVRYGLIAIVVAAPVLGGWRALAVVNGALVMVVVLCLLVPAVATGFFEGWLGALAPKSGTVALVDHSWTAVSMSGPDRGMNYAEGLLAWLLASLGFAAMPHALARTALNPSPLRAQECRAWSGLVIFLMLSAVALSLGLLGTRPVWPDLAALLRQQPVLAALPVIGLVLLALNALAVTLFVLAGSLARTLRRARNLDPGLRSMFATRCLIIALLAALLFLPDLRTVPPELALGVALVLAASGLFVPLFATIWLSTVPPFAASAAGLAGAGLATFMLVFFASSPMGLVTSGAAGLALTTALTSLAAAWSILPAQKRKREAIA